MKILTSLVAALLITSSAAAQTHLCDQEVPTSSSVAEDTLLYAEFCQELAANITAVTIYLDGFTSIHTSFDLITPTPNASGYVRYGVTLGQLSIGIHEVEISNTNQYGEGPLSTPFVVTVEGPEPVLTGCFTLSNQWHPTDAEITESFTGGEGPRREYIASMEALGWVLLSATRLRANQWTHTFRCTQ